MPICRRLLRQAVWCAFSLALASTGKSNAARMPRMAITTNSSIRVKAEEKRKAESGKLKLLSMPTFELTGRNERPRLKNEFKNNLEIFFIDFVRLIIREDKGCDGLVFFLEFRNVIENVPRPPVFNLGPYQMAAGFMDEFFHSCLILRIVLFAE